MNNELNVRQGIKSKGKMVKPLIFVNGEEDVRPLDFDPFEQAQKLWKKDSSTYNKMKQLTIDDICGEDQYTKCQAIKIQFANMIYYHINNLYNALLLKYTNIIRNDERINESKNLNFKIEVYSEESIYNYIIPSVPVFSKLWYNEIMNDMAPEMCLNINSYFTHDETIIDDMTIMLSGVIANKILNRWYPEEFAGIAEEIRKNFLREIYDGLYLVFCKAYATAAQYHGYAIYPAVKEVKEQLVAVKEENKEEDK